MKSRQIKSVLGAVLFMSSISINAAVIKSVEFESNGQTLNGNLYLPDNYKQGDQLPGVVVSGAWTTVKEQMPATYAEKLADKGYAALAFDFRGWGETAEASPASIQFVENPIEKTADISKAIDFMATLPQVDRNKLSTLGVCASAGYAINAAHENSKAVSTAVVAPWLHDRKIVEATYGNNIPKLMEAFEKAQKEGPVLLEAASDTNEDAVMYQATYYTSPERGNIPQWDNKFSTLSWGPWLSFDAIETASKISKPVLLVHSEAAAIPQGAKKFVKEAGDNVELIMMDEVTQFDFYDNEEDIDQALVQVNRHFQKSYR